jgi:hypothetical protein
MMEMNLGALFAGVAAFGWNTVFRGEVYRCKSQEGIEAVGSRGVCRTFRSVAMEARKEVSSAEVRGIEEFGK